MNTPLRSPRARQPGFSLVELMVSVVVGLLALLFATKLVVLGEKSKQVSLGGSDSMQNGMLALFSINKDAAQAGWGLNDPLIAGCNTVFSDTVGYALATSVRAGLSVTPMAAVIINSGGSGPDTLSFYAGSSMSGTGSLRVVQNYTGGATLLVDRVPYGFALGDVIVVAPETLGAANCALAQVALDPALAAPPPAQQQQSIGAAAASRFNAGALGVNYTGGQARLFNLGPAGTLSLHTWSVQNGFLRLRATDLAGASAAPATVIDNVVSIKAQYGFDTRLGAAFLPQAGMQIGQWSATMIDADGDGVAGGAGDFLRVAAVRVAVVARSKGSERPAPGAACTATSSAPVVFAAAEPSGVTAVPITLDVAVPGDALGWQCYRYRVFETIVPLRNAGWSPNA
jgi:type IV pilus assembly protein PilW